MFRKSNKRADSESFKAVVGKFATLSHNGSTFSYRDAVSYVGCTQTQFRSWVSWGYLDKVAHGSYQLSAVGFGVMEQEEQSAKTL